MHAAGLIHRDVKAENFVFAEPPAVAKANNRPLRVTLIDLGMAMKYDPESTVHGARPLRGSPPSGPPGSVPQGQARKRTSA